MVRGTKWPETELLGTSFDNLGIRAQVTASHSHISPQAAFKTTQRHRARHTPHLRRTSLRSIQSPKSNSRHGNMKLSTYAALVAFFGSSLAAPAALHHPVQQKRQLPSGHSLPFTPPSGPTFHFPAPTGTAPFSFPVGGGGTGLPTGFPHPPLPTSGGTGLPIGFPHPPLPTSGGIRPSTGFPHPPLTTGLPFTIPILR